MPKPMRLLHLVANVHRLRDPMFSKVLVANRAEIAVRVIRTCRELGISSVAIHSEPDAAALHVRLADEAILLPGHAASETYLDISKVVQAAVSTGAQAVHPGYGFLAENAEFARAVEAADLVFIGPPAAAIDVMGEKVAARAVAAKADVPQVPGSKGTVSSAEEILVFGTEHGYPIAIKASYGGGGRGMRTVASPDGVVEALAAAQREAGAAFGRNEVYLERYLSNARHVEVQVFADTHGSVLWLGDRDCSVQRRHQKVVEEAPAPGLSSQLRTAMGEASTRLARAVDYIGAGTVEFLVEVDREAFYFLEMNTRIQVEHPVTEEVLGLDLVAEQIRVAAGEPLSFAASGQAPRGHAIEVRVNAEDVSGGAFRPSPGHLQNISVPHRPGIRLDSGYDSGDEVLPYYDSLIGKLIVWAPTRKHAIHRTLETLREIRVEGVPTTIPAAQVILEHPDFAKAQINTLWLENTLDLASVLPFSPDASTDDDTVELGEDRQEVWVGGRRFLIPFIGGFVSSQEGSEPSNGAEAPGRKQSGNRAAREPRRQSAGAAGSGTHTSPMQGTVVAVGVVEGQQVQQGEILMVLEAMKMENPIRSTLSGTVTTLSAEVGRVVAAGTVLAVVKPSDA